MTMLNKISAAIIVSSVLLSPVALAEKQGATVTFEATIRSASCVVSSTTEGSTVNWGVFTSQELKDKSLNTQIGEIKNFHLTLTDCSAANPEDSAVNVHASGATSPFNPGYFANSAAKSLAVKLEAVDKDGTTIQDIKPNTEASVIVSNALNEGGFASIPMKASLMLVQEATEGDNLKVPVTFTVSYN